MTDTDKSELKKFMTKFTPGMIVYHKSAASKGNGEITAVQNGNKLYVVWEDKSTGWHDTSDIEHVKTPIDEHYNELYDELDEKIIDALAIDPKVHWSYEQRKAVKALITQQCNQARIETIQYVDHMLRFENMPLRITQAESLKQYMNQLQAQAKETE